MSRYFFLVKKIVRYETTSYTEKGKELVEVASQAGCDDIQTELSLPRRVLKNVPRDIF